LLELKTVPFEKINFSSDEEYRSRQDEIIAHKFSYYFDFNLFNQYIQKRADQWMQHKKALDKHEERVAEWSKGKEKGERRSFYGAPILDKINLRKIYNIKIKNSRKKNSALPLDLVNNYNNLLYDKSKEKELEETNNAIKLLEGELIKDQQVTTDEKVIYQHEIDQYNGYSYPDINASDNLFDLYLSFLPINKDIKKLLIRAINTTLDNLNNSFTKKCSHIPSARGSLSRMYGLEGR
jgi:hypothetical protein